MKFIDIGHPFYRPLWRRVVIVAICFGWGLFEFWSGAPVWGALFCAGGAWCAWALLWSYAPAPAEPEG